MATNLYGLTIMNPLDSNAWDEWKDDGRLIAIGALAMMMLVIMLQFIATNIPTETTRAQLYGNMLMLTIAIAGVDLVGDIYYKKKSEQVFLQFLGYGVTWQQALLAVVAGIIFGVISFSGSTGDPGSGLSISTPLAQGLTPAVMQVVPKLLLFVYLVLIAPIVEEGFFRASLMPTIANLLKQVGIGKWNAAILALIGQAGAFGYMHWSIYGASSEGIFAAIMFGLIAGIGNCIFQSVGFSTTFHMINNWRVYFTKTGGYFW